MLLYQRIIPFACLCILALLPACAETPRGRERPRPRAADGGDIGAIVEAYNTRVRDLSRLRAPVTMIIDSPKEGGGRTRDQVEGNLQVMLPSSVALRIDKVGQALAYLGSSDQQYWWFDLGDPKRAFVGAHAMASMEKARRFGLPVHPLDLVELAGVTPLPNASLLTLSRSTSGEDVIEVPGRWSRRRLFLDGSHEPVRIEVVGRDGRVAVSSRLSRYQAVEVDGNVFSKARIAGQIEIDIADADVRASIAVVEPKNPGAKLRLKAFDLAAMLESYNIKDVVDMDAPGAGGR
ncbi:MAG: hypothetical protein U0637_13565 [Phycisphaerales bacterium]